MTRLRYASVLNQFKPGDAAKFIRHLRRRDVRPGEPIVLWCRVSRRQQRNAGNLGTQNANLKHFAKRSGANLIGVVEYVGSGKVHDRDDLNCDWYSRLQYAAHLCRIYHATLVAESTDRFVRHAAFHSRKRPDRRATDDELQEFAYATRGIRRATLLPPNADFKRVKRYTSTRGQRLKNARGGRPRSTIRPKEYGPRFDELMLRKVLHLSEAGMSLADLAAFFERSRSTIQYCLKRAIRLVYEIPESVSLVGDETP